jgi:hypothetical protein
LQSNTGFNGKHDPLWITKKITTRGWVNGKDSFAIDSLRFFLHSGADGQFSVENSVKEGLEGPSNPYFVGSTSTAVPYASTSVTPCITSVAS